MLCITKEYCRVRKVEKMFRRRRYGNILPFQSFKYEMDSMFRFRRESLLKTRLRFFHSKIDLLIYIIAEDSEFSNGPI